MRETRALIEGWRKDYNAIRPRTSLGGNAPDDFVRDLVAGMPPAGPQTARQLGLFIETEDTGELLQPLA